jgi:hypothetical protein
MGFVDIANTNLGRYPLGDKGFEDVDRCRDGLSLP